MRVWCSMPHYCAGVVFGRMAFAGQWGHHRFKENGVEVTDRAAKAVEVCGDRQARVNEGQHLVSVERENPRKSVGMSAFRAVIERPHLAVVPQVLDRANWLEVYPHHL
eukprot:scaffold65038_cov65-Phaeocystis_antarctica.AAC.3